MGREGNVIKSNLVEGGRFTTFRARLCDVFGEAR